MADTSLVPNPDFDPYQQTIIITMPDGKTQATFPITQIFASQSGATTTGIIAGVELGMCSILLVVLLLMTKPDKRRSVVFLLNLASLTLLVLRPIFTCLELAGPFYNFYNWLIAYYPETGHAVAVSVTGEVIGFLSITAIELSMLFQTYVVCSTMQTRYRRVANIACVLVALQATAVRFALMVVNADWGIVTTYPTDYQWNMIQVLAYASNISIVCSVIFFSILFCAKLGHAIYQRHKMGMTRFGPMQMVFVMGFQTLFIPALFCILSFFVLKTSELYGMMPVIVATFLPLSSLWASTNANKDANIAAPVQWQHLSPVEAGDSGISGGVEGKELSARTTNTGTTLIDSKASASSNGARGKQMGHHAHVRRDSIDLEIAKMGHYIQVDRAYSVRSG